MMIIGLVARRKRTGKRDRIGDWTEHGSRKGAEGMSTRFPARSKEARENVGRAGRPAWPWPGQPRLRPPAGRHPFLLGFSPTLHAQPAGRRVPRLRDGWLPCRTEPGVRPTTAAIIRTYTPRGVGPDGSRILQSLRGGAATPHPRS
jgi:hypothetical protein